MFKLKLFLPTISSTLLAFLLISCDGDSKTSRPAIKEPSPPSPQKVIPKKKSLDTGSVVVDEKSFTIASAEITEISDSGEADGNYFLLNLLGNESILLISLDDENEPVRRLISYVENGNSFNAADVSIEENDNGYSIKGSFVEPKSGALKELTITIREDAFGAGQSLFTINGNVAELNGTLGTRTYNQVIDLLTNNPTVKLIYLKNVPGSVNDEINMQTGLLLREFKFNTHMPADAEVSSGGVDLFTAGVERTIDVGAKVGVHSWEGDGVEGGNLPENDARHNAQINYFTQTLGAKGRDFYFFTLKAAPADDIHIMSEEEIKKWGLRTK